MKYLQLVLSFVWLSTSAMAAAQIIIKPPALDPVLCYEKCELDLKVREDQERGTEQAPQNPPRLKVGGTWCNPFDPDEIRVDARVTMPSGRSYTMPAFYAEPYLVRNTPAPDRRREVNLFRFFLDARDWADGNPEILIAEIRLLTSDSGGGRVLDDFADANRVRPTGPLIARIPDPDRKGAWLLRFQPQCNSTNPWPGLVWKFKPEDWSTATGLSLRYKVKGGKPAAPLQLLFTDARFGNSGIEKFTRPDTNPEGWRQMYWDWRPWRPQITSFRNGSAGWKVRLTPTEIGDYRVTATLHTVAGDAASAPVHFTASASTNPGFIRISRDDPHYFVFDDGRPFMPIGHDIPWALQDVVDLFPKLAAHGGNATYFILRPNFLLFEWEKLGVYDLERAAKLDLVMETAREQGIYFKLSLDIHDAFNIRKQWKDNPYNQQRGGPCAVPRDFFVSDPAWVHYCKRLRYTVARWGYCPNIMAWEPITEMNGGAQLGKITGGRLEDDFLSPFYRKMAAELKRIDPYGRLFTTSYSGDYSLDQHWALPEIDYTQIHSYSADDPGWTLPAWTRELTGRFAKPLMFTEFGWNEEGPEPGMDTTGINLHNGLWGSLTAGASGALDWWWNFIEANNLYRHYPPLRAFSAGIDFPKEGFHPCRVAVTASTQWVEQQSILTTQGAGDAASNNFSIDAEGNWVGAFKPNGILVSRKGKPHVLRFTTDFPRPSTFSVYVQSVSAEACLEMRVDGAVARSVPLPAQQVPGKRSFYYAGWNSWKCVYNETYALPVPAGHHAIELENVQTNGSWIKLPVFLLERFAPPAPATVHVVGITGKHTTLLWLQNPASHWLNWSRPTPEPIQGLGLKLVGLPPGKQVVEWWNTWTGVMVSKTECVTSDGSLSLAVPAVERDIACRIRLAP